MAWKNYSLDLIPSWCHMPETSHFDGMGGCWGISHGQVEEKGELYCITCEFYNKLAYLEEQNVRTMV